MYGALNIDENKKLIVDESFEPSYSLFGQYLSNKNKVLQ